MKIELVNDINNLPDSKINIIKLGDGESPSGDRTVPYIKITPEMRRKGNVSKGEFNKEILKKVYEINKQVSMNSQMHRILYMLNLSGDKWFIPISEYADESDIFTFMIQEHNVNNDGKHLTNNDHLVQYSCHYEEFVAIGSMYFQNVDDSGNPVGMDSFEQSRNAVRGIEGYKEIVHSFRNKIIGNIDWASNFNNNLKEFISLFIRNWNELNKYEINASADCIEEKKKLLKSCLNTIYYRLINDPNCLPSNELETFKNAFLTKYNSELVEFNILESQSKVFKNETGKY